MHGSPLKQIFWSLLGIIITGTLLWHLTSPQQKNKGTLHPAITSAHTLQSSPYTLVIHCSARPERLVLRHAQGVILTCNNPPTTTISQEISLPLSQILDIGVEGTWADKTSSPAVSLEITENYIPIAEKTLWGEDGSLLDVFSFPLLKTHPPHPSQ